MYGDEAVLEKIWESANKYTPINKNINITPQFRYKQHNSKLELYTKCNVEMGGFIHVDL